ncbi:MAG: hypothetical protein AAGD40_07510 [Pseudomonadota bacterium]
MATLAVLLSTGPAAAQNIAGVFGPVVDPDDRSAEARLAYVPSDEGSGDKVAARLHYQQSLSDHVRLRGIVIGIDSGTGSGFDYAGFQGEAVYQFTEDDADFQAATRFDVLIGADGGSDILSINFNLEQRLPGGFDVRAVVLLSDALNGPASDGILAQTRAHVRHRWDSGVAVALELYNFHDRIGSGGLPDNSQLGPTVEVGFGDGFYALGGALFEIAGEPGDVDARLWLGKRF